MSDSTNDMQQNGLVPGVPAHENGFGKSGQRFWKSVTELAETEEATQWLDDEFPQRASLLQVNRRQFLTLGAAAAALAGASGCRYLPQQHAVPYVKSPEELIAGKSLQYASTLIRNGYGTGVLVESNEGRPTKIEGNPRHSASLGATDSWTQAELLNMYDPDRAQSVLNQGEIVGWDSFVDALRKPLEAQTAKGGSGIAILTESITSPTIAAQFAKITAKYPDAKWYQYDPLNRDGNFAGTQTVFGQPLNPVYRLRNAKVIVSLDADFMLTHPGSVRYAREFADGRRVRKNTTLMNRLYTIESACSITGAAADHRYPVRPSEVEDFARALLAKVSGQGIMGVTLPSSIKSDVLDAIAEDLQAHRGGAVVIPGEEQTPAVHALAHQINQAIGATGQTVIYTKPVEAKPELHGESLKTFVADAAAGKIEMLFILGGNPAYNAPADLNFVEAITAKKGAADHIPLRVRLSSHVDETAQLCQWHIPESHPLEAWGDARAFDGTASIIQPLIQPLYESKSAIEVLGEIAGQPRFAYDVVRETWQSTYKGADFEAWWATKLHDGVIENTAAPAVPVTAASTDIPQVVHAGTGMEILFRPDAAVWDGRFANNSWLQELPRPITTVVWDNVAVISPATAKELGITPKDGRSEAENVAQSSGKRVVRLNYKGKSLETPVWIQPGQPDNVITVTLGYGRRVSGNVGTMQGVDTYLLRTADAMGFGSGVQVEPLNKKYEVAYTQPHHLMRGVEKIEVPLINKTMQAEPYNRDIVRTASLVSFIREHGDVMPESGHVSRPEEKGHQGGPQPGQEDSVADYYRQSWKYTPESKENKEGYASLYPNYSYAGYNQWGMTIDMTTCIGCNACTIACQGREQYSHGRQRAGGQRARNALAAH